ncbi:MAG: hypothetical protein Q9180_000201 [Flavoplaca navasiana]
MLGWLSGAAQRGGVQAPRIEDGSPYINESPETPAPVFAVRAFKTALFGTPHPNQSEGTVVEEKASPEKLVRSKHLPRAKLLTPKTANKALVPTAQRATPVNSPAKGILVTPGTATTRRKTVSFGSLDHRVGLFVDRVENGQQGVPKDSEKTTVDTSSQQYGVEEISVQPSLTEASFRGQLDASTQRLSERKIPAISPEEDSFSSNKIAQHKRALVQSDLGDITIDYTVDLTKPRSQSGQHWKAEFERYQQNSDRELRKVIQHGKIVKSYAEKKDGEAMELQEKLKQQLDKCAAMETKVSKLATQLASSRHNGTESLSEQENLMNDLSRQTALAIRHKQKADRYRVAISQQKPSSLGQNYDDERPVAKDVTTRVLSADNTSAADNTESRSEISSLREELQAFRSKLSIAEKRATKLEATNSKLNKDFLRTKDEMDNNDARHVRKEARLKERMDALLAENIACEAKLKLLSTEHEDLLRRVHKESIRDSGKQQIGYSNHDGTNPEKKAISTPECSGTRSRMTVNSRVDSSPAMIVPTHPNSRDDQRGKASDKAPAIDIWTMDTPSDTGDMTPSAAEPAINLSSIAVSEATHEALREIDRNSVVEYPSELSLPPDTPRPTLKHLAIMDSQLQPDFPSSEPTSAAKRMADRRKTIPSPRPSMVPMASSTSKTKTKSPKADSTERRRDANRLTAATSRTSTLNGGRSRLGELPPDRIAAAKARIAQKQSLREGRRV